MKCEEAAKRKMTFIAWTYLIVLIFFSMYVTLPLIDTYFEYGFEADSSSTIHYVKAFTEFFTTGKIGVLPNLANYPPYYDGQYIIYAMGAVVAKAMKWVALIDPSLLPTQQSVAIFTIRYMNALAHVGSVVLLFLTVRTICQNDLIALLLGVIYTLGPTLINIDLLRVDWIIMFLLVLVIYYSLRVTDIADEPKDRIILGLGLAGLLTTKITSVIYLAIPVSAIICAVRSGERSIRDYTIGFKYFLAGTILLSVRYLREPLLIIPNIIDKIKSVQEWAVTMPAKSFFFYNYDYFLPDYGICFLIATGVSFGVSILFAVRNRDIKVALVAGWLLLYSVMGWGVMKYARNGYPFVLLYLLTIASGVKCVLYFTNTRLSKLATHLIAGFIVLFLLLGTVKTEWSYYQQHKIAAIHTLDSIRATRIESREWFKKNIPAGARIAIIHHSEWANPPLDDLGYNISDKLLNFPYLELEKMKVFVPPNFHELEQGCDIILLNDFHKSAYVNLMRKYGAEENAQRWEKFYEELKTKYVVKSFKSGYQSNEVREVEVIILNEQLQNQ